MDLTVWTLNADKVSEISASHQQSIFRRLVPKFYHFRRSAIEQVSKDQSFHFERLNENEFETLGMLGTVSNFTDDISACNTEQVHPFCGYMGQLSGVCLTTGGA